MNAKTVRTFQFSKTEVHEALIQWLNKNSFIAPSYTGDTPTTRWTHDDGGVRVEWTEEKTVELT